MHDRPERQGFATRIVHAGEPSPRIGGAIIPPVFQSTVFESTPTDAESGEYADVVYPRLSNLPNHTVLAAKLANLEGAEAALVTASGMAAASTAMLSVLRAGDHVIATGPLYGGTHALLRDLLPDLGIEHSIVPPDQPDVWREAICPNTRAFWTESLTNPLVRVPDHAGIVAFAQEHELVSLIDATFSSPCNFRPIEAGYQVVVHSATKYLNGHSDIAAGVIASSEHRVRKAWDRLSLLGGSLDAHACYLLHRGLRTLEMRVERQNATALTLAQHLAEHPAVSRVYYPGLPEDPDHAAAERAFGDARRSGGVLAFELAGAREGSEARAAVHSFLQRLSLAVSAPSLGGPETLVTAPRLTSHASLTRNDRSQLGLADSLLRVAVGFEDPADILAEFDRALGG